MFQFVVAALAVNVAVLASLGPIVAFFSVSTTSYSFIFLLNVTVFVVSGVLGGAFLLQILNRWSVAKHILLPPAPQPASPPAEPLPETAEPERENESQGSAEQGSQEQPAPVMARLVEQTDTPPRARVHVFDRHVRTVFISWMIVFGLVCAQMAWVLRPFLGKPSESFHWFCARESNFLVAFWEALRGLFS
jgi:hypothetical protein